MKILLAYDGFTHSENALATAADLGRSSQAEITILSVVPPDARGSKSGAVTAANAASSPPTTRWAGTTKARGSAPSTR